MSKVKVCEHKGFEIYFEAEEEHVSMYDHFINECGWTKAQFNGIKNCAWFSAKVTAEFDGLVLNTQYLGCCSYKTEEEFYTKYKDDYFKDMMNTAVDEALECLPNHIKRLEEMVANSTRRLEELKGAAAAEDDLDLDDSMSP